MCASSMLHIISLIGIFILPESPKFLLSMDRKEEALQVLHKMYNVNTTGNGEVSMQISYWDEENGPNHDIFDRFIRWSVSKLMPMAAT